MAQRKWVRLKSGGHAIPMRLDFLLTPDDLARILSYSRRHWVPEYDQLAELSKAAVEKEIRDQLRFAAWESFYFWSDNVSEKDSEVVWEWAVRQVERTYGRPPS